MYICPVRIKENIPNALTCLNLCCGVLAIVILITSNQPSLGIWSIALILLAGIFDFLDGLVARALNVSSPIGKELDSLADVISFGVAPGIFMFRILDDSIKAYYNTSVFDGLFFGFISDISSLQLLMLMSFLLIPVFSAIRLAKFNVDTRQTNSFIGLPTPANAMFIISVYYTLFIDSQFKNIVFHPLVFVSLSVVLSYLLIAPIPLFALKFKNYGWQGNQIRYVFILVALALFLALGIKALAIIILLYIVFSVINNLVTRNKHEI